MTVIPRTAARTDRERMTRAAWLIGLGVLLLVLPAYAGQSGTRCWSYPASRNGVIRHPPSQRTSCPHYERLTVSGVNFLLFFLRLSPRSSIR